MTSAGDSPAADRWLQRVPTFRETSFRVTAIKADFVEMDLGRLAEALDVIAALAEQADERAHEVLTAAAPTLTDPSNACRVEALREVAQLRGHFALARLLRHRQNPLAPSPPEPEERGAFDARAGRPLTLGERKSLARGHDRFLLDRLLRDPHPAVIRNVLVNPRITETDVVRLAARRPTYPDIQVEIARSERWSIRPRVRVAIVQNPYTPPTISVPLVALLLRHEIEEISKATDLPPILRAAAIELLERRPPVPSPRNGATH
jgi:hypothetical protein